MPSSSRRPVAAAAVALALAFAACDGDGINGPGPNGGLTFSRTIGLPDLENTITSGPARLEIELIPGSLTSREVEVQRPTELTDEEEIESRIVQPPSAGTLVLAIDGLEVQFNSSTEFRGEDGDLTMTEFLDRVNAALSNGEQPAVEAKRPAPSEPQDPTDATFLATRLELDDESGEPEIEINVDTDNLELFDAPAAGEPDGVIRVLGLEIELRVSEGITELEEETEEAEGGIEFEGLVSSVDPDPDDPTIGTVTLGDETVIRIVLGTEIEDDSDDGDDEHLTSLAEVQTALDDGFIVEADGEGVLESADPRTLVAIEVEFEIEDDEDGIPGALQFESTVASVDVGGGTITLADDRIVRIAEIVIDDTGDLLTLQEVADALPGPVRVEGHATVESVGPPAVLVALDAKFEVDD
ncbi:MAG: hypothetical protein GWN99_15605 [Gemmatimonadetes bacterium]|uniref:DUF5666 domain-containing protein n=1 Tax=Candidatus Kutchimonas denitrificans TaxID=3056748 RepID=A0AAE4Z4Q9_9BACT|nr:hypothetical protein [Gemmatimonadota bacterium]NIR73730.1 hypothetical protein [Candidatus Kutchimonas denitrificans]NIS02470.1 hypothetical protein [Gemmatimonadota bacterium]NIT67460.1 hypothetical protein [Gemmatimonadota bacterium]NIU51592.1 hypothetical protein [Gemmatimonadota bacterium]